jgi:cell division protein FtsI (penicillin-binding protein 3)
MQTLAFYNAVANNGVLVKPQFVSEIKEWNKTIVKMEKKSLTHRYVQETLLKLKAVLKNVVKEGQGQNSTQRTSRWQVKQGQHKLIMAKMVGQANTMLRLWGTFRQITLSFLYSRGA